MKCAYTAGPLGCGDDAVPLSKYCAHHGALMVGTGARARHTAEKRRVRRGTIALGASMLLGAVFALGGYFVAGLFVADPMIELRAENARLKHALELFTRNEGSCAVQNNGPRVLCGMRDGYVARRELAADDQVVTGRAFTAPTKRKRKQ